MNAPRVLVVQSPMNKRDGGPAFDFSRAEIFGEVEVIAQNGKMILTPDVFREVLEDKLCDFDADRDFIIPAGDYSVIFYVGMILGARFKRIRLLRWVNDARAYQPLVLNL